MDIDRHSYSLQARRMFLIRRFWHQRCKIWDQTSSRPVRQRSCPCLVQLLQAPAELVSC